MVQDKEREIKMVHDVKSNGKAANGHRAHNGANNQVDPAAKKRD